LTFEKKELIEMITGEITMNQYNLGEQEISEDPNHALQDILAQTKEEADALIEMLNDFFVECPDAWDQFREFWKDWSTSASEDNSEDSE